MADRTPIFNPPQDHITTNDPSIIRIPLEKMDWAARSSQQHSWDKSGKSLKNLPNGR